MGFDGGILDYMFGKSPEKGMRLLEVALRDSHDLFSAIESALERQDFDVLRDSAHALKSVAAQVGAHEFSVLCKEMQNMDDDLAKAQSLFEAMRPEKEALVLWLEGYREDHS